MVVTNFPSAAAMVTWQERTASPSMSTVQAPQSPVPQPYFVPVRFDASRSAQSSGVAGSMRSEEHTSELQSLMRISYAVFCLKTKTTQHTIDSLLPNHTYSY